MPPNRAAGLTISIHALREEGDGHRNLDCGDASISIHALREEGDLQWSFWCRTGHSISIHALREERSEERRVGKECRSRWSPYH